MRRILRRHAPVWAFVWLLLFPTASFAASAAEAYLVLDDTYYFVRQLDRGWERLLTEFETVLSEHAGGADDDLGRIRALRDDAYKRRADSLLAAGDRMGALERYDFLAANEGVAPDLRAECRNIAAGLWTDIGDEAKQTKDYTTALDAYGKALDLLPDYADAWASIVGVGKEQAKAFEDDLLYTNALGVLRDLATRLSEQGRPEIGDVNAEEQRILSSTGVVQLDTSLGAGRLANFRGPKADFTKAVLDLRPKGGQRKPDFARDARMPVGPYDVTVSAPGGSETFSFNIRVESGGSTIRVPNAMPVGMVLVPAVGGGRSFLIDRTEVSVAQFNGVPGVNRAGGPPNAAASGVSYADALRYAQAVQKDLPTEAQWKQAAFGSPNPARTALPWTGGNGRAGVHFNQDPGKVADVNSCPQGASTTCGALNMVGNVFEWLQGGWIIGGSYRQKGSDARQAFEAQYRGGNAMHTLSFLHDKAPLEAATYSALPQQLKDKFVNYPPARARQAVLSATGLRCVIPLE